MRIKKGTYGLKQAGIIANQELVNYMAPFRISSRATHTWPMGPWQQNVFSLVVDNLCVQYWSTEDSDNFLKAPRAKYLITVNMEETVYIGIKIERECVHRTFTLSIPSYTRKALHRFQHILRGNKEYSPHKCASIKYGHKAQYADPLDAAEYLSEK